METIKANTKRGQSFLERYYRSTNYELFPWHNKFSTEKTRADYLCREQMHKENGL